MEHTILTFTCGECGRDGFKVVDRNPPIPLEVISIYDKDNEGEDCTACRSCATEFPIFSTLKKERTRPSDTTAPWERKVGNTELRS